MSTHLMTPYGPPGSSSDPPPPAALRLWDPLRFAAGYQHSRGSYAVCILNQPLQRKEHLLNLCEHASLILCADGGANRLKDLGLSPDEESRCTPHIICGDFDSVRSEVLDYYQSKGSKIVKDEDQYSTDPQKCLNEISRACSFNERLDILMFGGLSGRADQAFSLVHQLYVTARDNDAATHGFGDLYLITRESLIFLLEKGTNSILTRSSPPLFTPNVGIIPIGRPSMVTTHGLEWDITDWPTQFGDQISTSNHIVADSVEVETTERVLFTMEWATTTR